jgi:hypothetical protein
MTEKEARQLGDALVEWFSEPEHYSIVHFAIEHGMSEKALMRIEDEYFKEKLEYAFSVMEYKVTEGALSGSVEKSTAMKLLEKYCGFKSDISVYQKIEQSMSPELAQRLTEAIEKMDGIGVVGRGFAEGFGEVRVSESGVSVVDGGGCVGELR